MAFGHQLYQYFLRGVPHLILCMKKMLRGNYLLVQLCLTHPTPGIEPECLGSLKAKRLDRFATNWISRIYQEENTT